ncbi:aldehyde dehydrogenase family protein [Pseudonocardia thermophila]|uniref:aldehyde dehydrogenase family protein n=1 Tax=Pseudonocardia thermophila TaxID=1848 RepID=UPI00248E1AC1|nr:aldehyde dehydrogenase family protein [Pseudonocardia thermophila]
MAYDGPTAMYIDGEWVARGENGTAPLTAPFDGRTLAVVPVGGSTDVDRAVRAAGAALRSGLPLHRRLEVLEAAAVAIGARREEFARTIALECAKPIRTARVEVGRAVDTIRFSVAAARTLGVESVPLDATAGGAGRTTFTKRVPIGVVGAIAPFNFPLNLVVHKVAPALALGCPVVLKPATQTPLSSLLLAQVFHAAGLPAGWLNVVCGSGSQVGHAVATHPDVAYVTFTGSPQVGWGIAAAAPKKKVRLELGSNAPLIVDRESDWAAAADQAVFGGYVQAGQSCVSTQRIFVHEDVVDAFTERLAAATRELVVGDPLDEAVDVSAVINEGEAVRVEKWITEAVAGGARLVVGGDRSGAVVSPTILRDVDRTAKIQCQEVFGPVVTVNTFTDFGEAIAAANDSDFGLNAGVFTTNLQHALRAIDELEFGSVYINDVPTVRADQQPYGGVKESGNTREGPRFAMEEMTELKFVTMR